MKSYSRRILERLNRTRLLESMDLETALDIFGIREIPSPNKLKSLYKKLAFKYHPDLGGSADKMTEINVAYKFLSEYSPSSSSNSSVSWEDLFI